MRKVLMIAVSICAISSSANAADTLTRACDVAKRTVENYTDANVTETMVRMTALFQDLEKNEHNKKYAWTDMMAFAAQHNTPEGKPILKEFISDVCNDQ